MIAVLEYVALIWVTGTLLSIAPSLEALARLTEANPRQMCAPCRARRQRQRQVGQEWRTLFGHRGAQLMVVAAASGWPVALAFPTLLRQPRCIGPSCAAHPQSTNDDRP